MAYRPSKRAKHGFEWVDTNVTPMMNLMVVLIPLLLTSAEFVKLGVIELNLPPAAQGQTALDMQAMPVEETKKLDLTVTITDQGFFISSSLAVLSGDREGAPTIPLIEDEGSMIYDFDKLSERLLEIKQAAQGKFPDTDQIILLAEPDINYQTVVSTMDASRSIRVEGSLVPLFPEVALSAGVF